jgi:hypothetical protein
MELFRRAGDGRPALPAAGLRAVRMQTLSLALLAVGTALAIASSAASADFVLCSSGTGAGNCQDPQAVAVDASSGRTYVAAGGGEEGENVRVDIFEASGAFVSSFGSKGTGPGQFKGSCPGGAATDHRCGKSLKIAVDNDPASPSFHDVYVADEGNNRIEKFDSSGSFLLMFGKGVNAGTSGKANVCTNAGPPTDVCGPGFHEVDVQGFGAGQFNLKVQLAVGPSGTVYVADSLVGLVEAATEKDTNHVQKFSPLGDALEPPILLTGAYGDAKGLAIDSTGGIYFADTAYTENATNVPGGIHKYSSSGTEIAEFNKSSSISALATDAADNLFVADATEAETTVYEYDSAGGPVRTFYGDGTQKTTAISLAPYSNASGDIFAVEGATPGRVVHVSFPPPGPVIPPDPKLLKAEPIGNVRATLKASVNPEGKASTVHFEYVDDATFQDEGFSNPIESPESALTPADFKLHEASTEVLCESQNPGAASCLKPDTRYHFRAVASDGLHETKGPEAIFETKAAAKLGPAWSTDVGIEAATVHADLNPLSLPTTAYFEYIDQASFEASGFENSRKAPDVETGAGEVDFGSGEAMVSRSAPLYPLVPGTTYHYRYVASDFFGTFVGPERILRTFPPNPRPNIECYNQEFRTGASAALSDCRAYELVSPLDKNNGDIISPLGFRLSTPVSYYQSSIDGAGLTYSSVRAFADPKSAPFVSQYLARRDAKGGWSSESISPPRGTNVAIGVPELSSLGNQFKVFSSDLCDAWLWQDADPPLGAPSGVEGYENLYRADLCGGGYEALTRVNPPTAPAEGDGAYRAILGGYSDDKNVAVYSANDQLTANANPGVAGKGSNRQVYAVYGGGKLRLVSVLPSGSASKLSSQVGTPTGGLPYNDENVTHAVSVDGSRIFWTAADPGSAGQGKLYLRVNSEQPQSALSGGECTETSKACTFKVSETVSTDPKVSTRPARFRLADRAGTRALFTIADKDDPVGENLYEFDVSTRSSILVARQVEGVLGAGEDAAQVYFLSRKALGGDNPEGKSAVLGQLNLYLRDGGAGLRFIATLEGEEAGGFFPGALSPFSHTARVSKDGKYLAFASRSNLTGYENLDAASGKADREVFRYDATANGGAGRLDCVSCNPSGSRPMGRKLDDLLGDWTAAQIPNWQDTFYAQRVLSDDGSRLYFESFDALLPSDRNGRKDVYQWELAGAGDCQSTGANYFAQNGGCLSLISSGTSGGDSEFVDAAPSGSDVFFTTASSLLPQDYGLVDIYDARIGGGFPPPPVQAAGCEGEACQSPPAPPNDPTPASSAFDGAGNIVKPPRRRCAKNKVRRHGHCVAKKHHRHAGNAQRGRRMR